MSQNHGNKQFDLAVLIDSTDQYNKVLIGPILYELKARHLHFVSSKKYINGDIKVVNKACTFVQEIDTETFVKGFIRNACDITNSFSKITKIRLFKFKNEQIWTHYLASQKRTHSDICVVVNDKAHPISVLLECEISCLDSRIKCETVIDYQRSDINLLNIHGRKMKNFFIDSKWKLPKSDTGTQLQSQVCKSGVCYNFIDSDSKHSFLHQSYDCALVTNDKNEMQLLLTDITYIYAENVIVFASVVPYKNGYYPKLKQCGEALKSVKAAEYRLVDTATPYTFERILSAAQCTVNKCMLFNIRDIDAWLEYISIQTSSMFDIGVITNRDEYQSYFLNKCSVNWLEKGIVYGAKEKFTPKHHGLITKFGKLIKSVPLSEYALPDGLDRSEVRDLYLYQWQLHKGSDDDKSESDSSDSDSGNEIGLEQISESNATECEDSKENERISKVKKEKRRQRKKDKKSKKKSRKTVSALPNGKRQSKKLKKKKDRAQRNGKTRSEIVARKSHKKKRISVKKHRKKDSVLCPSVMRKLNQKRKDSVIRPVSVLPKTDNKSIKSVVSPHKICENKSTKNEPISVSPKQTPQTAKVVRNNVSPRQARQMFNNSANVKPKSQILSPQIITKQKPKIVNSVSKAVIAKQEKPKIVNKSMKNTVITDPNEIWDIYVEKYGMPPKNTYMLQNFAKNRTDIQNLKYKDLRQLFKERAK